MKNNAAFYIVITIGVFLLAGQAYAMSGSMGDSKGHGSMTGDQKVTTAMPQTMGNSGQQGAMKGAGPQHEPMSGTMPQGMMQGGAEGGNGRQQGRMHGAGSDETTQPPATSTTE